MILCDEAFARRIDRGVFPGAQGGPLMHVVAGKAVSFLEAATEEFKAYSRQIVENAQALAATLNDAGLRLVSGGTDNHLLLVDVTTKGLDGQRAEDALARCGIIVNKNAIPYDTLPPRLPPASASAPPRSPRAASAPRKCARSAPSSSRSSTPPKTPR